MGSATISRSCENGCGALLSFCLLCCVGCWDRAEGPVENLVREQPRWDVGRSDALVFSVDDRVAQLMKGESVSFFKNWEMADVPEIRLSVGEARVLREDGISSIHLIRGSERCPLGSALTKADQCLQRGQNGTTRLSVIKGSCGRIIVEADIAVDESLMAEPEKMRETLLHEMGHALGLPHLSRRKVGGTTIMEEQGFGVGQPTVRDRAALGALYSRPCQDHQASR